MADVTGVRRLRWRVRRRAPSPVAKAAVVYRFVNRLLRIALWPLIVLRAGPIGLGGGGAMYWPTVSPLDASLMFVTCDMGGVYRSVDGGLRWKLLDARLIRGAPAGPVVCDPNDVNVAWAWGPTSEQPRSLLHRSADKGQTWNALAPPPAATRVTSIAVDRVPAGGTIHRVLCGTDVGPFYSDDNGQTWQAAAGTAGPTVEICVLPDPATGGAYLYFHASSTQIYSSADRGQTWQPLPGAMPLAAIENFSGGANAAVAPSVVLYATGGGSFTRSEDRGQSWTAASGGSFGRVGASDGNPHAVYATTGYPNLVSKSTDRGQSWSVSLATSNPASQNGWLELDRGWGFGGGARGFAVSRSTPDVALFSNAGALYVTTDGSTWRQAYTTPAGAPAAGQPWRSNGLEVTTTWHYDIDPSNPQTHYISYTDIGFARSDDGGSRWYAIPPANPWKGGLYNTIYEIAFDPSNAGWFWAAASDVHDIPHDNQLRGVYAGQWTEHRGSGGVVRRSGGSWTDMNAGLPQVQVAKNAQQPAQGTIAAVPPVVSIVVDPRNADRLWCAVFGLGVYAWDNITSQWVARSNGLGFADNMHVYRLLYVDDGSTAGRLFCSVTARRDQAGTWVANSGLFRSDDGGLNWTHITAGANVRYAADYAVSSSDPNTIYLCSLNRAGADGALYRTTNGLAGAPTWTTVFDINSIPQKGGVRRYWPYLGCFSVTVDPAHSSNVFLLTATHGIWLSRAAGDPGTWQEFRAIPFLSTHRMVVTDVGLGLWGADESVYVTTFGAGVWSVGIEWWWRSWFCQWRWWNWLCRWLWRCWCWPWYWERPIRWLGWPPWPWQTRGTSPRGT